jgi:hypothetical protein
MPSAGSGALVEAVARHNGRRITITAMSSQSLRAGPLISRWAARGAVSAGLVGGVVGLVVGLRVNPATAWFAIFELGIPSSILGGIVGLASGAIAYVVCRIGGRARTSNVGSNHHPSTPR